VGKITSIFVRSHKLPVGDFSKNGRSRHCTLEGNENIAHATTQNVFNAAQNSHEKSSAALCKQRTETRTDVRWPSVY